MRVVFSIEVAKVQAPGGVSIEGVKLSGEKEVSAAELRAITDNVDRLLDRLIPVYERMMVKLNTH